MTPSLITQLTIAALLLAAVVKHRAVVGFLDDLGDGNVERMIRGYERAMEAGAILAVMQMERVG